MQKRVGAELKTRLNNSFCDSFSAMSRKGSKKLKLRPSPKASDEQQHLLPFESRRPLGTVSLQHFLELADKALHSKLKRKHK